MHKIRTTGLLVALACLGLVWGAFGSWIAAIAVGAALVLVFEFFWVRPLLLWVGEISSAGDGEISAVVVQPPFKELEPCGRAIQYLMSRLEGTFGELRRVDELEKDFLSTISHELRTPLTAIGGYAKVLLSGDAGEISATQKEFLGIIDSNVDRLANLINDILDTGKLDSGKIQLIKEPQDLSVLLGECIETCRVLADQKGLRLRFLPHPQKVTVLGDRARLLQVFMNLLSNAVKYTEKGEISVAVNIQGDAVQVEVKDTGIGLSEEDLSKIFQKFFRTRTALLSNESGTGLGLTIVQGLVVAHGGSVSVESKQGQGSSFFVTLPLHALAAPKNIEAHQATHPEGEPLRLWLLRWEAIEGERIQKLLAIEPLAQNGAPVVVEQFESVDHLPYGDSLKINPPKLLIIEMDGVKDIHHFFSELRGILKQRVPMLLVGERLDPVAVFAEGASALIVKPLRKSRLIATVKNLISAKSWRVLVADENTDLRLLLKRSLKQEGVDADDIDRGSGVLSFLEKERYDLLIIGARFADISSEELLAVIRKNPEYREVPIFMLTDERSEPISPELSALGVTKRLSNAQGIEEMKEEVLTFLEERPLEHFH